VPESGHGPGVIVIQEWWGLVEHIKNVCDRFAEPATWRWRRISTGASRPPSRRGRQGDDGARARPGGEGLSGAVDELRRRADGDQVGVIGFCRVGDSPR